MLIIGRFITGFGVGSLTMTVPVYQVRCSSMYVAIITILTMTRRKFHPLNGEEPSSAVSN
jgi:hypothetical protein